MSGKSLSHASYVVFFQESARAGSVGRGDVGSVSYRANEYYQLFESRFFLKTRRREIDFIKVFEIKVL